LHAWIEFLVDDYQADSEKEDLSNQEPNELAIQLGIKYGFSNHNLLFDFTLVRNRTYNDPVSEFSKYTDHNQLIGFTDGNNLIQFNLIYQYQIDDKMLLTYHLKNTNRGDEGLWAKFNRDYLLEKGYIEPVPFGEIKSELENSLIMDYRISSEFLSALSVAISNAGDFIINLKMLKYFIF
jgi:hypothetical protein